MQPKSQSPSGTHSAQIQPVSEYNRNLVNIQPQHVRMNTQPVIQVPLPHGPASNATRELDDLMASLSDFKVRFGALFHIISICYGLLLDESNERSTADS